MWLITPIGFFSIVQKSDDKTADSLTIRARVRSDLVALQELYLPGLGPIQESANTDYRYRAKASRNDVAAAVAHFVRGLDYGNFKSEVAKTQGQKRSSLYHNVWDVLYKLQFDPGYEVQSETADSYGGVVVSGGRRVLLRQPTNQHGGYAWTFAKTEAKSGETLREAAIRAVREKTGYDAQIRVSMPGLFKGAASSTNYFLMDAGHPPAKPNWQTTALRWVEFDEARDLIRQSPLVEGRDRDLAILDAVQKAANIIPYKEHANVQPEDWRNLQAMSERHVVLHPAMKFSAEEMAKIRRGFYPTEMEQKWFIYFTGTRLRLHRSWTGYLCFDVGFVFDADGCATVTDVVVSREVHGPDYRYSDDADLKLLEEVIHYHLLEPLLEPEVDGMVKAMMQAMKPNYLGSPEVVSGLVQEVFDAVVKRLAEEATQEDVMSAVVKVIAAFTDDSSGYTRLPWNSAQSMGVAIWKYLAPAETSSGNESLSEILWAGLSKLVAALEKMLAGFMLDPAANWEEHGLLQLNAMRQFVVTVLLGTNSVFHGDKTLKDYTWQPVPKDVQIVLHVGCEGGSIRLLGLSNAQAWQFRVEANESLEVYMLEENSLSLDDGPSSDDEQAWGISWRRALKRMDKYQWTQLYPMAVHPEFAKMVKAALKTREKNGVSFDWGQWNAVLNV
jgi:ADP-ribose pyrophosphatase YjhB (NUDIX family)